MDEWKTVKDDFAKHKDNLDYSKVEYKVMPSGKEYMENVDNDPAYSLEVDPTNKYHFNDFQKNFIQCYCEYKNLAVVANLLMIEPEEASGMMRNFSVLTEIKRINKAQYHQRISTKMMSLDEIGGYLTSMIADDVPTGDQVDIKQKMNAAKLLIDIQKLKLETSQNPEVLNAIPVENLTEKLNNLTTSEIKELIYKETSQTKINQTMAEKNELISKVDPNRSKLTPEERACLETLSTEELKILVTSNADPSAKFKEVLKVKKASELAERKRQADLNTSPALREMKAQIEEANSKSEVNK